VGAFENREYTKEEHAEWAAKLWARIDRDHSGSVSREELNCDEFQDVLHAVIAPDNTGDHANYGRAELHINQALDFLLRKTQTNADGNLTFKEFKSFTKMLRNQGDEHNRVHLIFALFDLDGSNTIDREEFHGIYAFFAGHQPTKNEVDRAFLQMDKFDKKEVTRQQFIRWLQREAPPQFQQHTAHVDDSSSTASSSGSKPKNRKAKKVIHRPAPGMFQPLPTDAATWSTEWHVFWNDRFRGTDTSLMNPACPERLKRYFSAPQTLPELDRFFNTYRGFNDHRKRLHEPRSPAPKPILSTQSKTMEVNPERAAPGGWGRNAKGGIVLWDNEWPDKPSDFKNKPWPGSLMLRCSAKPPPLLTLGREADHQAYRAELMRIHGQAAMRSTK
jgi:Ca2+-binding EF-hand superfamily protein